MIELKKISKFFKYRKTVIRAIDEINLTIERGEMISVTGPSGSGKTTLLNVIGGIYAPTLGEYIFEGSQISKKETDLAKFRNKNVGFILQDFALIQKRNVIENISLPLLYSGIKKDEIKKKVVEISEYLGILDKLQMYPYMLSGGECQRVAIARAVINNPKIILADEPTSSVDNQMKKEIVSLFRKINEKGITVIVSTHDMEFANQCDRTVKISEGKII